MAELGIEAAELSVSVLNSQLSDYRIVREVGHGSMGVVYEARQVGVERRVAIKVLPPNMALRDRTVKRFLREAEAMGRLSHPNIVDIHQVDSQGSLHYFSMKFVEGPPLDRVLRAGPLAIADVIAIGIDVAGALAHAHSRGVLHRDVKPSNLLRDGERVVLTDFGLARPLDQEEAGTMTESGDLVGTPLYMSPEQISAGESIDARADVWGLGATLYELLAQRPPFGGSNAQQILHSILHKDPTLLRKVRDDVPRDLEAVLLKCLEKDASRRYATAAGLLDDLKAVRDNQPVSARPPRFFDPAMRWVRRHPLEAAVGATLLVVAGAFAASWRSSREQASRAETAKLQAQQEKLRYEDVVSLAHARSELLQACLQWQSGGSQAREQAMERIFHLIDFSESDYPEIVAEAMELLGVCAHQLGLAAEDALSQQFETKLARFDRRTLLELRAAMYTGCQRFADALQLHIERARLDPRDPKPYLAASRINHRLGLAAREVEDFAQAERCFARSLLQARQASSLAVRATDSDLLVSALIEHARTLVLLDQPSTALLDLERALKQDKTRTEAHALKKAAENRREELARAPQLAATRSSGPRAPLLDAEADLFALTKDEFASAGKGLMSIIRDMRGLLTTGEGEEAEPTAAPADATTPQARKP